MTFKRLFYGCFLLVAPLAAGCSGISDSQPSIDGSKYLLSAEPAGAKDVLAARESVNDGDEVVVVGRIGGSTNPWNEGRAAFSIVDRSLLACSDREGDECQIPWDYCCEPQKKLSAAKATVRIVDEQGKLVEADARQLLNVKELQTVVVSGKAKRDDVGNLTVLASEVFVKK